MLHGHRKGLVGRQTRVCEGGAFPLESGLHGAARDQHRLEGVTREEGRLSICEGPLCVFDASGPDAPELRPRGLLKQWSPVRRLRIAHAGSHRKLPRAGQSQSAIDVVSHPLNTRVRPRFDNVKRNLYRNHDNVKWTTRGRSPQKPDRRRATGFVATLGPDLGRAGVSRASRNGRPPRLAPPGHSDPHLHPGPHRLRRRSPRLGVTHGRAKLQHRVRRRGDVEAGWRGAHIEAGGVGPGRLVWGKGCSRT